MFEEMVDWARVRACLNPPPESIATNRMDSYLPHELLLIGHGERIDSVQPGKNGTSWKRKRSVAPLRLFFLFGRTGRQDRTGTNSISFDVNGHHRTWTWTPICAQQRVGVVPDVQKNKKSSC